MTKLARLFKSKVFVHNIASTSIRKLEVSSIIVFIVS